MPRVKHDHASMLASAKANPGVWIRTGMRSGGWTKQKYKDNGCEVESRSDRQGNRVVWIRYNGAPTLPFGDPTDTARRMSIPTLTDGVTINVDITKFATEHLARLMRAVDVLNGRKA